MSNNSIDTNNSIDNSKDNIFNILIPSTISKYEDLGYYTSRENIQIIRLYVCLFIYYIY